MRNWVSNGECPVIGHIFMVLLFCSWTAGLGCEHVETPEVCGVDGIFYAPAVYPVVEFPEAIAVDDFDSDGNLDLAVGGGSGDLSILLGRGSGVFRMPATFSAGAEIASITTSDFDSDGILDLAQVEGLNSWGRVFLGNGSDDHGDVSFSGGGFYETGDMPTSIAAGDFNSDGKPDLAVSHWLEGSIYVFINRGRGPQGNVEFDPEDRYSVQSDPNAYQSALMLMDFDLDGILDIVVAYTNGLCFFRGLGTGGIGNGTFDACQNRSAPSCPRALTWADFDSDGLPDLAIALDSNEVGILLGSEGLTNEETGEWRLFQTTGWPLSITTGDFDRDGIMDLATANYNGQSVSVLLGNGSGGVGDGTFSDQVELPIGQKLVALTNADLNGDGFADLIVAVAGSDTIRVFLGGCRPSNE